MVAGSPVLPLPVEFVAGGEGKPEPIERMLELGLGGSGSSGSCGLLKVDSCGECNGSWLPEVEPAPLPMKTADTGLPCFGLRTGRGGIAMLCGSVNALRYRVLSVERIEQMASRDVAAYTR